MHTTQSTSMGHRVRVG